MAPRRQTATAAAGRAIRVRMYRVGFGDCFLVSLPRGRAAGSGADGFSHLLFDCGVHARGDIGTLEKVVADIARETGSRLAVLVATHAHQDHIAGYDRFADRFAAFRIGEVWLPWTWNPDDPGAAKLQKRQAALVARLAAHFSALAATRRLSAAAAAAQAALENMSGNAHAISRLRQGFGTGARVRYLEGGQRLGRDDGLPVPGLSVTFLGPPRSPEYLAKMDPPAGNRYLSADGSTAATAVSPFSERWKIDPADEQMACLRLEPGDIRKLESFTSGSAEAVAFALDSARNNESVVALLRFGTRTLLFPGDAQYGNWRWWMEQEQLAESLDEVSFLKVSHHGSVNATPKDALERMGGHAGLAAMVSTQSTPWPSIPRGPLMTRLDECTGHRVFRSDWVDVEGVPGPPDGATPPRPAPIPPGFEQGEFWVDYTIPLG